MAGSNAGTNNRANAGSIDLDKVCQDFHSYVEAGNIPDQYFTSFQQLDVILQNPDIQQQMRQAIGVQHLMGSGAAAATVGNTS